MKLTTAVLLACLAAMPAQAQTCTPVSTVPYTITTNGVYCLTQALQTSQTSGAAITITGSNVVLDLNGFGIRGATAGVGTTAIGVQFSTANNVVKNGYIRGFYKGIEVTAAAANGGTTIENVMFDATRYRAIDFDGHASTIRNNYVVNVGGSTVSADPTAIRVTGPGNVVSENRVSNFVIGGSTVAAVGIEASGDGTLVEANVISGAPSTPTLMTGILLSGGADVLASDNRLLNLNAGLVFSGATGKYARNLAVACSTAYSGGTDAGGNN